MKKIHAGLFLLLALAITPNGCSSPETAPLETARVLVIGIDGAEWNVIDSLREEGRMPNLQKLIEGGTTARLASIGDALSPVVWTTVATGKTAEKHGIHAWVTRSPDSPNPVPVNRRYRKVKTLWNILSERGRAAGITGWLITWPAEEVVGGYLVTERLVSTTKRKWTYPDELAATISTRSLSDDELRAGLDRFSDSDLPIGRIIRMSKKKWQHGYQARRSNLARVLKEAYESDQVTADVAARLARRQEPCDLTMVYLRGVDWVSHKFFGYYEPADMDLPAEDVKDLGRVLPRYYEFVDGLVGNLVDAVSPTATVILSDHGFGPDVESRKFDTSFILQKLGLLSKDGEKTLWNQTSVYEISRARYGMLRDLYLNVQGREPNGIIPAQDYDRVRGEIQVRLQSLRTESGKPLYLSVEHGPPPDQDSPSVPADLICKVSPEPTLDDVLLIDGKRVPASEYLKTDVTTGSHRFHGILIMKGEGIKQDATIKKAGVLDITPTILHMLGLPVAEDMEGKVLLDAFTSDAAWGGEVRTIATYEGVSFGVETASQPEDAAAQEEMERLKALGYVE